MRLIDADLFMEKLLSMKKTNKELPLLDDDPEVNNYDVGQEETFDLVIRKLSEQPTVDTRKPMTNIVEKLEEREKYLERAMKENYEKGYSSSEAKAMNERVAIRYAINIVKQEINNGLE